MSDSTIYVVVMVVIALSTIAVVLGYIFSFEDGFNYAVEDNTCRATVIKASLKSTINTDSSEVFPMCPSKPLGVLDLDDYSFAKTFLDESESCWKKFGSGKINPIVGDRWSLGVYCFSCFSFQVKEPITKVTSLLNDYSEIVGYDLDGAFLTKDGEKIYLISKFDSDKVPEFSDDPTLEAGEWYSLVNMFLVNRDSWTFGYWNSYETYAKLALIKNSDVQNVCYGVQNV